MKVETAKYRLVGTAPILGSTALNKTTFEDYIAPKANKSLKGDDPEVVRQNMENAKTDVDDVYDYEDEDIQRPVTGFFRDAETGDVILKGYQIKGFFKAAAKALKDQLNLTQYVAKIDNFVFIVERNIPIMRNGEPLKNPDSFLERPLRGETAKGPRISLAKSEMIEEEWYIDLTVKCLANNATAKSVAYNIDLIDNLFMYGELKGLVQWRNAGYGSFTTYKYVDVDGVEKLVPLSDIVKE